MVMDAHTMPTTATARGREGDNNDYCEDNSLTQIFCAISLLNLQSGISSYLIIIVAALFNQILLIHFWLWP